MPPLHVPPPGYAIATPTPAASNLAHVPLGRKRSLQDDENFPPHKMSAFSRLGGGGRGRGGRGRGGYGGRGRGATKVAVRNIPPNVNNIAHLNNHFARFGTLVNVQVRRG